MMFTDDPEDIWKTDDLSNQDKEQSSLEVLHESDNGLDITNYTERKEKKDNAPN